MTQNHSLVCIPDVSSSSPLRRFGASTFLLLITSCFPYFSQLERLRWKLRGKRLSPRRVLYIKVNVNDGYTRLYLS